MATGHLKNGEKNGLPAGVSGRSLVKWGSLVRVMGPVFRAFGISTDGLDLMETAHGLHLRVPGNTNRPPFWVDGEVTDGVLHYTVEPGTAFRLRPKLNLTAELTDLPAPIGTAGLTCSIYVRAEATLNVDDNYVFSYSWDDAFVLAAPTLPDDDQVSGIYYIELATFVNGIKTSQPVRTSFDGIINDSGNGDGKGVCSLWSA